MVLLLVVGAGCSSSPKRPSESPAPNAHAEKPAAPPKKPQKVPPQCGSFCETIHACAAKAGHGDLGDLLCDIARCETGDKCTGKINSPNARYRGAFQFSPRTWRTQCGPVFRELRFPACQDKRGIHDVCCSTICSAELVSRGGIGNWPTCGPKAMSKN